MLFISNILTKCFREDKLAKALTIIQKNGSFRSMAKFIRSGYCQTSVNSKISANLLLPDVCQSKNSANWLLPDVFSEIFCTKSNRG